MTKFPQQIQSCGLNDHQNCYSSISSVKKNAFTIVFLHGELAIYNVLVISPFYSQLSTTESVLYIVFSPFLLFLSCFWLSIHINVSQYLKSNWVYIMKGNECLTSETKTIWKMLMCMLWRKELNISKFTIFKIQRSYIWGINRTNWWFLKLYVRISWY